MTPWLREAALDALALVLPVECAGCARPDRALCDDCRGELLPCPELRLVDGFPVVAGLRYDGVARRVLLALKDGDRPALASALAPALAEALRRLGRELEPEERDRAELCLVPSTRAARRRRGYAPVRLLARSVGVAPRDALRAASVRSQKLLGVLERERNVHGAFRLRDSVAGRRLVLLDDIVTTGSTLAEAGRTLERGGARVLAAVVVASTPRRRASPGRIHTGLPPATG